MTEQRVSKTTAEALVRLLEPTAELRGQELFYILWVIGHDKNGSPRYEIVGPRETRQWAWEAAAKILDRRVEGQEKA